MPYFLDNNQLFNLDNIFKEGGLRECQQGALLAAWSHFTTSDEPAVISMPTGSGKTDLMTCLSFFLKAKRILIVEPSSLLRNQTAKRLEQGLLLREFGLISEDAEKPLVKNLKHQCKSEENWNALSQFDVVVATPKTISPGERGVSLPPEQTLFDLIFIDEAHHLPAATWRAILSNAFPFSKYILLTATPFRRDRRRLPGKLIYHYPISKAIDNGIYSSVTFIPVPSGADDDRLLAEKAYNIWEQEQKNGNKLKVIVRVDKISKAERLVEVYRDAGLAPGVIHSEKSNTDNSSILASIKSGELNTVICVGMMGEGIDIPSLKIAVVHNAPQSLAFTIQLVGRVSRNNPGDKLPAFLLAIPDSVKGEVKSLYLEDHGWSKLLPRLVENVIQEEFGDVTVSPTKLGSSEYSPVQLKPYFSVRIYRLGEEDKLNDLPIDFEIPYLKGMPKVVSSATTIDTGIPGLNVVIVETNAKPVWSNSAQLLDTIYDLCMYYKSDQLLFVASTSESISEPIRKAIAPKSRLLEPENVAKIMQGISNQEYFTIGLRNALGISQFHPSYKVHLGSNVLPSVKNSEGKVFGAGHVIGKSTEGEIQGVSVSNRKAWVPKRDNLTSFVEWCNDLSTKLNGSRLSLPGLDFLAQPKAAEPLEKPPVAIILSVDLLINLGAIKVSSGQKTITSDIYPLIKFVKDDFKKDKGIIDCQLHWHSTERPIRLRITPGAEEFLTVTDERSAKVLFSDVKVRSEEKTLATYLRNTPPTLILPRGGIIQGDTQWVISDQSEKLDDGTIKTFDWKGDGCDIRKEAKESPIQGKVNVQEKTLEYLTSTSYSYVSQGMIIVRDDGAGEISDYVVIEPKRTPKLITFVHCKYSSSDEPGRRLEDLYVVLNQACRSHVWCYHQTLIKELSAHIETRKNSEIAYGEISDLEDLAGTYESNEWKKRVIIVQPGTRKKDIESDVAGRAYLSIVSVQEWLKSSGMEMEYWAHI